MLSKTRRRFVVELGFFRFFSEKLIKSILILSMSQFTTAEKTSLIIQQSDSNYKSKTTIITERGDTMAGGGELLNKTFFEILDTQQFAFYKYYDVLFNIGLKPNEVHTLSIILSFNKAGKDYLGSCNFISKKLNITSRTALNTLTNLANKGFIKKQSSKGGNVSIYSINEKFLKDIFLNYEKFSQLTDNKPLQNVTVKHEKTSQKQWKNSMVNSGEYPRLTDNENIVNYGEIPQKQWKNSTVNSEKNSQLTDNKDVVNYEKNSQKLCKIFTVNYENFSHNKNIYKNNNKNIYAHLENEQVYNHKDDKQKENDSLSSNTIKQETKNKAIKKQNKELNELQEKQFDKFWQAYPKKVSKKQAQKSWKKINPSLELFEKILKALEMVKQTEQWEKDNGKFIPYPATWLNQERWTDEINMMQDNKPVNEQEPKKKTVYKPLSIDMLTNNF